MIGEREIKNYLGETFETNKKKENEN